MTNDAYTRHKAVLDAQDRRRHAAEQEKLRAVEIAAREFVLAVDQADAAGRFMLTSWRSFKRLRAALGIKG